MPQPNGFDPSTTPPLATRRCPVCGNPMFLALIEPTYQSSHDVRTFECPKCAYAEILLVNIDDRRGRDPAGAIQHETFDDPEEDKPTEGDDEADKKIC